MIQKLLVFFTLLLSFSFFHAQALQPQSSYQEPELPGDNINELLQRKEVIENIKEDEYIFDWIAPQLNSDQPEIEFGPNPFSEALTLFPPDKIPHSLRIIDGLGRVIVNTYFSGKTTFYLNYMPKGVFFLEMDGQFVKVVRV